MDFRNILIPLSSRRNHYTFFYLPFFCLFIFLFIFFFSQDGDNVPGSVTTRTTWRSEDIEIATTIVMKEAVALRQATSTRNREVLAWATSTKNPEVRAWATSTKNQEVQAWATSTRDPEDPLWNTIEREFFPTIMIAQGHRATNTTDPIHIHAMSLFDRFR